MHHSGIAATAAWPLMSFQRHGRYFKRHGRYTWAPQRSIIFTRSHFGSIRVVFLASAIMGEESFSWAAAQALWGTEESGGEVVADGSDGELDEAFLAFGPSSASTRGTTFAERDRLVEAYDVQVGLTEAASPAESRPRPTSNQTVRTPLNAWQGKGGKQQGWVDGTWYYGNQAPNRLRSGRNGGAVRASPSGGANAWWYRRKRGLETGGDAEALAKFLEDNPHPKSLRGKNKGGKGGGKYII